MANPIRVVRLEEPDREQFLAAHSDPALRETLMPVPVSSEERSNAFERALRGDQSGSRHLVFGVKAESSRHLLGIVSYVLGDQREAMIAGFIASVEERGKGLGTQAAAAVLDFAFLKLRMHRVAGSHLETNPAPGAVMRKIGMIREGRCREQYFVDGAWVDVINYSILESEWEQIRMSVLAPL